MLDRLLNIFRRALIRAESDLIDRKFDKIDDKLERFDERMDNIEISQCQQNEKLSAIHNISLANNECLEQKLNSTRATSEAVSTIMDTRFKGFEESFKRLESLVVRVIQRECDRPE